MSFQGRPDALNQLVHGILTDVADMAMKLIPIAEKGGWTVRETLEKLAESMRDNAKKQMELKP